MTVRKRVNLFVLAFFLDGAIDGMSVYSDLLRANRALRRYVKWPELRASVRRKNPTLRGSDLYRAIYGAMDQSRFAGTSLFEVPLDPARAPVSTRGIKSLVKRARGKSVREGKGTIS